MDVNPNLCRMREIARTPYGERLYAARKKHAKISQQALAEAAGTTQSNIAELEISGQGSSYTAQFALKLGVRVEWLATGAEPMVAPIQHAERPGGTTVATTEPSKGDGLANAIAVLGHAIEAADQAARDDVLGMLTLFVRNPSANAGQLPLIIRRLLGEFQGGSDQRSPKQA